MKAFHLLGAAPLYTNSFVLISDAGHAVVIDPAAAPECLSCILSDVEVRPAALMEKLCPGGAVFAARFPQFLRLFPEGGQPHTLPFHRPLSDFAAFVAGLHPVGKAPPVGGEKGGRHLDPGPFGGRREMRHLYPGTHGGDPFTEGWLYQPHAGVFHAGDERGRGENRHHPAAHLHREHLLCDRPFPFFLSANEFLHRPFPPFVYQDSVNFPFFSRGKEETMIKYDFAGRFTRNHLSAAVFIPQKEEARLGRHPCSSPPDPFSR